jgi:hypothetical protein
MLVVVPKDASQLVAAFHTNQTVTEDFTVRVDNLQGAALGNSLSGLMESMPQLQRLDCHGCALHVEGVPCISTSTAIESNFEETESEVLSTFRY